MIRLVLLTMLLFAAACGGDDAGGGPNDGGTVEIFAGNNQSAAAGSALQPIQVRALQANGEPAVGVEVAWSFPAGCGSISQPVNTTDVLGIATTVPTLSHLIGDQAIRAKVSGHDPVTFHATATAPPDPAFHVLAGCNNVPERYGSDLWVADGYGYSGTWGFRGNPGDAVKIWKLNGAGHPALVDSIIIRDIGTVSDVEVSPDGRWLIATAEGGGERSGLYVYELTSPGHPVFRARQSVPNGLHTGTLSVIGGKLYAFTAKDPLNCALQIYDLSDAASGNLTLAKAIPIPDNYCIHDTFVRDGLAFVFAWNEGLYIFDVGKGSNGGSPADPKLISHTGRSADGDSYGGETHNGWWFWNPTNGEKKYLFVGEEGPGNIGASSSGSIHVVDVSNLAAPVQVASYTMPGAGAHNFWMDEQAQVLYAAFYNGGIVALDVSGTLSGDLASREIARIRPGGASNTYVWGVMLSNGYLYASDMVSGFWQLAVP